MSKKLTLLGTGGSVGVPIIGCDCGVCTSISRFNNRLRSSALLEIDHKQFLIDAGPDFRQQALRQHIQKLDGVILTHAHQDHTAGLDDLRPIHFNTKKPIPILLSQETADDVLIRFHYLFKSKHFDLQILPSSEGTVDFQGVDFQYLTYKQTGMKVNGIRKGSLAYLIDVKDYSENIFEQLQGVKILIINALRFMPSPMHLSVDDAIEFSQRVGAEQTWLTHLSHDLDYDKANAYLPSSVRMAYDGLEINFD